MRYLAAGLLAFGAGLAIFIWGPQLSLTGLWPWSEKPAEVTAKPVAVVWARSASELRGGARWLLKQAGQNDAPLDLFLLSVGGPNVLNSIDRRRPVGFYLVVNEQESLPDVVGFVPIEKEDAFLNFMRQFGARPIQQPDKTIHLELEESDRKAYLRFAHGYAFLSWRELSASLPEPNSIIPANPSTTVVGFQLQCDAIPKEVKQDWLRQLKTQAGLDRKDLGSVRRFTDDLFRRLILETRSAGARLERDAAAGTVALELYLQPLPETSLATGIKGFGKMHSRFAGISRNGPLSSCGALPLPAELRRFLTTEVKKEMKNLLAENASPGSQNFYRLIDSNLDNEALDIGIFVRGPMDDGTMVGVMGLAIKEGKRFEKLLRDSATDTADKDIQLDVARFGGTTVHRFNIDTDEEAVEMFGANEAYLAVRDDMVIHTMGSNGLAVMKEVLAEVDRPIPADSPSWETTISLSRFEPLFHRTPSLQAAMRKVFAGQGRDRMRVIWTGGNVLRLRYVVDAPVIALIGMGAGR